MTPSAASVKVYSLSSDDRCDVETYLSSESKEGHILLGPEQVSVVETLFHPSEGGHTDTIPVPQGMDRKVAIATNGLTPGLMARSGQMKTTATPMGVTELVRESVMSCPPILQRCALM